MLSFMSELCLTVVQLGVWYLIGGKLVGGGTLIHCGEIAGVEQC